MKALGLILLILGILMTLVVGVKILAHNSHSKQLNQTLKTDDTVPVYWSPYAGILLIGVGGTILIYSRKKIEM